MEIPKLTEEDRELFLSLVPDRPDVVVKPMFGNLGAYVNGNMFMGSFGAQVGLKLADADRAELLAVKGAGPFGPDARPMGGYVALPPAWRTPTARTAALVAKALEHVAAMPPKVAKARKSKA
jgi:TfoX/Sxy family transcriptional regulator of competence genes